MLEFVCVMYGYVRETSVNAVRTKMLKKMIREDEALTARSQDDYLAFHLAIYSQLIIA